MVFAVGVFCSAPIVFIHSSGWKFPNWPAGGFSAFACANFPTGTGQRFFACNVTRNGLGLLCSARGRVGNNAQTRNQIRQLFPSRRHSLARRLLGVCANDCRPATLRKGSGVISGLNRVTAENRIWRLRMRRNGARPSDSPTLLKKPRELSTMNESAGCNSGRRNQPSLGMADHWTRLFKVEATDRPLSWPNARQALLSDGGGLSRSLPPVECGQVGQQGK